MSKNSRYTSKLYEPYQKLSEECIKNRKSLVAKDELYYPKVHLAPPFGLLNDPNGLAYFNGFYYIFYQYHPNNIEHGLKHWQMYKTKDFITYIDCGIKLAPHSEEDNFGVYSGGAMPFEEELLLFYTANHRDQGRDYKREQSQYRVSLAKDDSITERQQMIPYDATYTEHFRDPYPFLLNNQEYLLVGGQRLDESGCIVVYECKNRFRTILSKREIKLPQDIDTAYMLECPCLLQQNQKLALIFSPQGLVTSSIQFPNVFDVVYILGDTLEDFENHPLQQLDYGFDFYAPQVFNDGTRSILVAWLGQALTIYPYDEENGWSQMLTIPREVSIRNNKIYQTPIRELKKLRKTGRDLLALQSVSSRVMELEFTGENFEIKLGNDTNYIKISLYSGQFTLDRFHMDQKVNEAFGYQRHVPLSDKKHHFQFIIDSSAIEIFIDEGEYVLTSRFFIKDLKTIVVDGNVHGKIYDLNSLTIKENS